jgi:hypothetical protein
MAKPSSKDAALLNGQIDACADIYPTLIDRTRAQENAALSAADLATARQLDQLGIMFANQYATLLKHELKEVDDSVQMDDAIQKFARVNQTIQTEIQRIQDIKAFTDKATEIARYVAEGIQIALEVV